MKRTRVILVLAVAAPVGYAAYWFFANSRAATETPECVLIRTDGKFEIRDYPVLATATAPMDGEGMNGGFGRLFRFITGSNDAGQKIAMTSPVLIDTANDKRTMSFVMPKKARDNGVPKPTGAAVTVGEIEASRFAVLRFRGGRTSENEARAVEKLRSWLATQKIVGKGEPVFAYYDPPWTPIPMRRNEVMIRIDKHRV
jgi:hypothetical protein